MSAVLYHGPDMELWGLVGTASRAEGFWDPESIEFQAYIFETTVNGSEVAVYCDARNLHLV